jgi:hypothetical protein
MGLYKFSESNFINEFESSLDANENHELKARASYIANGIQLLAIATNLLEEAKQNKCASALTALMLKIANLEGEDLEEVIDLSEEDLADLPEFLEEEVAPHNPIVENFYDNKEKNEDLQAEALDITINLKKKANLWNVYLNKFASGTSCETCQKEIKDENDAIDVEDYSFCSSACADKSYDQGLVYDCNASEDGDLSDVNDAKKCSGYKKAPVGSPKQRAFCKRHCGMKKKLTSKKVADDPDSCINQGLRRWKCRCS